MENLRSDTQENMSRFDFYVTRYPLISARLAYRGKNWRVDSEDQKINIRKCKNE